MSAFAASISGCQNSASFACDGWKPIYLKRETVNFLVKKDEMAANAILSHNEFGQKQGCWKPK